MNNRREKSGMVLVAVVCFTALAAIFAASMVSDGFTHIKLTRRQVEMEQAFYAAEAGAEHAVAFLANGGTAPARITGIVGAASANTAQFFTVIVEVPPSTGPGLGGGGATTNVVSGSININPNNSPDNEFMLIKPDGTTITRDDLANDTTSYTSTPCVYYTGPAALIHVKPKGNGNQNSLIVNGTNYNFVNSHTYDIVSMNMNVQVYNDSRNMGNGRANGQWWVGNIAATNVAINDMSSSGGALRQYTIFSSGRCGNGRRMVILEGVQQQTWARYALWYDHSGGEIWIVGGEVFNGPVHANTFIYLSGNPIFNALVSSTKSSWGSGSSTSLVQFNQGYAHNVPAQTMASISFTNLQAVADMVVTGVTHMRFAGTNVYISNTRQGWTNYLMTTPTNGTIYVKAASSGSGSNGIVYVGGVVDGRVTLVADEHIYITNHLTYATHPTNNSDDALGLIAQKDVVVRTNAPNNLNVFAHIIACNPATNFNAGFHVQNYSTRPNSGALTVYGGIVQMNRGAVGSGANGFIKNYTYDQRFENNPPPNYPTVSNIYLWKNWREEPY